MISRVKMFTIPCHDIAYCNTVLGQIRLYHRVWYMVFYDAISCYFTNIQTAKQCNILSYVVLKMLQCTVLENVSLHSVIFPCLAFHAIITYQKALHSILSTERTVVRALSLAPTHLSCNNLWALTTVPSQKALYVIYIYYVYCLLCNEL